MITQGERFHRAFGPICRDEAEHHRQEILARWHEQYRRVVNRREAERRRRWLVVGLVVAAVVVANLI